MQANRPWLKETLLYLALALVFIAPRLFYLDQYVTADENLWLRRSANFYYALGQRDYRQTFQMPHPGVVTSWAGTGGFLAVYPAYRGSGAGNLEGNGQFHRLLAEKGVAPLDVLVASRIFVVLICAAAMLAAFGLLRVLVGLPSALVAFLLIAFDPFYFFLSRLLHLDALMTSFAFLSLMALFAYLLREHKWYFLVLSGVAAGFSWLSKSPGMFLIPFTGLLVLIAHLLAGKRFSGVELWALVKKMMIWGLAGGAVFVLFWPAMWVDPIGTVQSIFDLATTYAEEGHLQFFYGQVGNITFPWWYYPVTYMWRSSPLAWVGLALAVLASIGRWGPFRQIEIRRVALALLLFAIFFLAFMQIGEKRFDRYALPIYLALALLAALGWVAAAQFIVDAKWLQAKSVVQATLLAGVVLAQAGNTLRNAPYYASAYNPWMGGAENAAKVMTVGWGEGLDQAAAYLNAKPDTYKLHVFTTLASGPFSYFSESQPENMVLEPGWGATNAGRLANANYVVIYVSQWQRHLHQPLLQVLVQIEPEYVVDINGVDYVQVYDTADIPVEEINNLTSAPDP